MASTSGHMATISLSPLPVTPPKEFESRRSIRLVCLYCFSKSMRARRVTSAPTAMHCTFGLCLRNWLSPAFVILVSAGKKTAVTSGQSLATSAKPASVNPSNSRPERSRTRHLLSGGALSLSLMAWRRESNMSYSPSSMARFICCLSLSTSPSTESRKILATDGLEASGCGPSSSASSSSSSADKNSSELCSCVGRGCLLARAGAVSSAPVSAAVSVLSAGWGSGSTGIVPSPGSGSGSGSGCGSAGLLPSTCSAPTSEVRRLKVRVDHPVTPSAGVVPSHSPAFGSKHASSVSWRSCCAHSST